MRIGDYEVTVINGQKQIIGEYYKDNTVFPVAFKSWQSPDGKVKRIYITRAGEQIGWISPDYTTGQGKSSTNQTYINRMLAALQNAPDNEIDS